MNSEETIKQRIALLAVGLCGLLSCWGCSSSSDAEVEDDEIAPEIIVADTPEFEADRALCEATFRSIGDRHNHWIDVSKYSKNERVVMLVWHTSALIDNGGFELLFSGDIDGDPDFQNTAEAFKLAGLDASYNSFQKAIAVFTGGKVPTDIDRRYDLYVKADEKQREQINREVWREGWNHVREAKLADFIRKNPP